MTVKVKAKRDFPRLQGDGQSRQLVPEGAEIEVSDAEARKLYDKGYINKPDVDNLPEKSSKKAAKKSTKPRAKRATPRQQEHQPVTETIPQQPVEGQPLAPVPVEE